jgi:hypothetical protein
MSEISNQFPFTHKVCPICKENKEVSQYPTYFSKARGKHRIGNYCKPCGRNEAKPRAIKHYQDNREYKLQYSKDYRANPDNKEKLKKLELHFKKKYREELQDCYIRDVLSTRYDIPVEVSRQMPEIVEAKRLQIKIRRKIKTLKNGKEQIN